MRVFPVLSLLVAAALCDPAAADDASPVPRALATATTAPPANVTDAAAIEALRKYYGSDVDKLTPEQLDQLVKKLHSEAKDQSSLDALLEDSKDWFAKVGSDIKAIFVGKDDKNKDNDGGVFSKMWKSLFGEDAEKDAKKDTKKGGSGSGSMGADVGASAGKEKNTKTSSGSKDDTSIETVAPAPSPSPTPKPKATTATPKSSSRGRLLTSLPVAGTLAAIFVINFVQ